MRIGTVEVAIDTDTVRWTSGMSVDGDGSPRCYAPLGSGLPALDDLRNAGRPGGWYGIVTDLHGNPIIQLPTDPWPGYYVSCTALSDHSKAISNPTRYLDAEVVPYISIPPELTHAGVRMGDVALVSYGGQSCAAVVADVAPAQKIGEGSIALALRLGIPANPKRGGVPGDVNFTIFLASSKGWPRSQDDIDAQVQTLYPAA